MRGMGGWVDGCGERAERKEREVDCGEVEERGGLGGVVQGRDGVNVREFS